MGSSSSISNNNNSLLSPILDPYGIPKHTQRKIWKDVGVGGGQREVRARAQDRARHERHQKKKDHGGKQNHKQKYKLGEEDYYYTYKVDYETGGNLTTEYPASKI